MNKGNVKRDAEILGDRICEDLSEYITHQFIRDTIQVLNLDESYLTSEEGGYCQFTSNSYKKCSYIKQLICNLLFHNETNNIIELLERVSICKVRDLDEINAILNKYGIEVEEDENNNCYIRTI